MRSLTWAALIKQGKWERWFAWYSVTIGDEDVWLEFVERKPIGVVRGSPVRSSRIYYEYREVLK